MRVVNGAVFDLDDTLISTHHWKCYDQLDSAVSEAAAEVLRKAQNVYDDVVIVTAASAGWVKKVKALVAPTALGAMLESVKILPRPSGACPKQHKTDSIASVSSQWDSVTSFGDSMLEFDITRSCACEKRKAIKFFDKPSSPLLKWQLQRLLTSMADIRGYGGELFCHLDEVEWLTSNRRKSGANTDPKVIPSTPNRRSLPNTDPKVIPSTPNRRSSTRNSLKLDISRSRKKLESATNEYERIILKARIQQAESVKRSLPDKRRRSSDGPLDRETIRKDLHRLRTKLKNETDEDEQLNLKARIERLEYTRNLMPTAKRARRSSGV